MPKNPVLQKHLKATPFHPTKADVRRWTEFINHLMFQDRLPKLQNKNITIRPLRYFAQIEGHKNKRGKPYGVIKVSDTFESFGAFYSVMIHEMVHLAEFVEHGDIRHGKFFYSHRELCSNLGVKLQSTY